MSRFLIWIDIWDMNDRDPLPPSAISNELLDRFLAGECTPAEEAEVRRAMAGHARERVVLDSFVDELDTTTFPKPDFEHGLRTLHHAILNDKRSTIPRWHLRSVTPLSSVRFVWYAAAAASIALAAAGVLQLTGRSSAPVTKSQTGQTYVTQRGQRASVRLPDGSLVVLGPETELRYTESTVDQARSVHLKGQAYFDVQHSANAPFTIVAGTSVTQVLGTAFSVTAHPDRPAEILVASGRVAFGQNRKRAILSAGMSATLPADAQTPIIRSRTDVATSLAWVEGILVFENTPIDRVLEEVGRWYGVEFKLHASVNRSERITGRFVLSESSEQVIQSLASMLHTQAVRRGTVVQLTPR